MATINLSTIELLNGVWDRIITLEGAHSIIDPTDSDETFLIISQVSAHTLAPADAFQQLRSIMEARDV